MRLKKLEIYGFKSFADKSVLEFHEGITGIVGPNGCGKSNIADAFRWVLGEQSAKSMRGGKMHDVIFAGTTKRSPLNIAEVTITLTDVAGHLPIDYDEVSITRRLHRNGDSDYLINRHPVRLKDVQDLLLGSGIGKNAFSIFEQGKIDQIIHYGPIERRGIFEEAAGILRFLQRKRDAIRKLEQVDSNLERIRDIHLEVEKQISVLEKQAEKARDYKEKKTLLQQLDKALFVAKFDHQQKKQSEIQKKREIQQEQLLTTTTLIAELDTSLRDARIDLAQSDKSLRTKSEELFKTRSDKEIKVSERQSHHERLKELSNKEKRWQQELSTLAERQRQRLDEATQLQNQQKELEITLKGQEELLQEHRDAAHSLENTVAELRDEQQGQQQIVVQLLQTDNQIESELKQNNVRQENLYERRENVEDRQQKLTEVLKDLTKQAAEKKRNLELASQAVDEQKTQFSNLEIRIQTLTEEIQNAQQVLESTQQDIADAKARQKVLIRLRDDMEGFSAGSKRLLKETADQQSPLFQKVYGLYEFISSQNDFDAALASILRPYSQTLVAKTANDFTAITEYAKTNNVKDFSLVCIDILPKKQPALNVPKTTQSLLQSVVDHVLSVHFLKNVYVTDTKDQAQELLNNHSGISVWIKEGMYLDPNGVLFYSSPGENNVFMREAELKKLEKQLLDLEKRREECDLIVKQRQLQRNELLTERTVLDKSIRRDEMTLVEVNFGLQRTNNELEKSVNEDKQLANELKTIENALETLAATVETLKQKHAAIKNKSMHMQEQHSTLNSMLEKQVNALKKEKIVLQEKEINYRKGIDEHKKLLHSIHILEVKESESKQQESRLNEEIQSSGSLQSYILKQETELEESLHEVEKALDACTASCKSLETEVSNKKHQIESIEKNLQTERNRTRPIEEELQRLGIQNAQLETTSQTLLGELNERYQLSIEQARQEEFVLEKSIEQAERQLRTIRQDISQIGDINMTAIEEFDHHTTRYTYLTQQINDLDGSKKELLDIISELDGESRKLFKETFEQIRENFKKNFQILFNGGEADLTFTDHNDVLEAGIEIIAKPPGKQMRSIQLLSGGEKCMTAVALLFALFEVKPAPFCILDEIDAPLDESNVVRFVNLVKEFINRCQFVIITHNKRTMSVADVLFGVSMEERGVSKLLSMSFAKNAKEEDIVEPAISMH